MAGYICAQRTMTLRGRPSACGRTRKLWKQVLLCGFVSGVSRRTCAIRPFVATAPQATTYPFGGRFAVTSTFSANPACKIMYAHSSCSSWLLDGTMDDP